MSRKPNVTYQNVLETCQALLTIGEKPNVKKICDQIGGSFSTVGAFFKKWQEEQRLANQSSLALSESFQQAALIEFARINETVKKQFQEELEQARHQFTEIQSLLVESESKNEALNQALLNHQETSAKAQLTLEKGLALAQALGEDKAKREAALQTQVERLQQSLHEAQIKAAVLEAQHQEIQKQNHRLEQEIKDLKSK